LSVILGLVATRNSNVLNDGKSDEQLLAQSAIEETWEELVVAGPITVNYIGNLMVLSSKQDFAFRPSNPNHVYQHIQYPNSFRTTLVQIANKIYNVFRNAHSNMDRIQLDMQQIPRHLKTVLQLLTSASPRLIQSMLPTALGNIERIAKQCADLAKSTMKNYESATLLLQEVTEVSIDSYGSNTASLANITMLVNNSLDEQQLLNVHLEDIRKEYENAKEILRRAREDYYAAFHAIPTRPKRFVGVIVGGLIGGIVGGALGGLFSGGGNKPPPPIDNTAFQNAKEKAELALKNLREAEAKYDEWYSRMIEKQNKLTAIIVQMSQLQMNQFDHKTTINILVSATKEIAEIEKQWSKMTRFFSILAMRAEATRETVLYEFIDTIKNVTLINGVLDDADREFFVLQMLDTADEIEQGAHLLYIMAKTYYDVSSQYMLSQISGISALAVIQTDDERQARMTQLAQDTLSTSAKVSRMALERKQQYEQRNQARQDEYKKFIQQITLEELGSVIGK
jgi:predicted transcriptional regulator